MGSPLLTKRNVRAGSRTCVGAASGEADAAKNALGRTQPSGLKEEQALNMSSLALARSVKGQEIGIGGHLAMPPLPHHRAYGDHGGSTGLSLGRGLESGKSG